MIFSDDVHYHDNDGQDDGDRDGSTLLGAEMIMTETQIPMTEII